METFLVTFMATKEQQAKWKNANLEDQEKGMAEWMAWADQHKANWVDIGNPVGANLKITKAGVEAAQNEVCGYSLLKAENAEAATEILKGCPHFDEDNTWIDMMEVVEMG